VQVPATLPALLAVSVLLIWTANEGGYPTHHWYPGALFLLGLLLTAALVLPGRLRDVPRPVLVAGGCLIAYALWSYASIGWADDQGEALDGANRTLLYVIVFTLFAMWPQRPRTAAFVLGAWTLGVGAITFVTLLSLAGSSDPESFFISDRLAEPAGYINAAAATTLMAFWPAIVLAGRGEVPWWVRGMFAAAAVVLADICVLSQSRGAIFSFPIVALIFFVVVPGRVRSLCVCLAVAPAVAVTVPGILEVVEQLRDERPATEAVANIAPPVIVAALLAGVAVTAAAWIEGSRRWDARTGRRFTRTVGGAGIAGVVLLAAVVIALTGDPVTNAREGWDSFRAGKPVTGETKGPRLSAGLGSDRYDAYRVALDSFTEHPLIGVGADNFLQDYLAEGRSDEQLRYPHSLPLRALSETGIVGALLLLGVVGGVLAGAGLAIRGAPPLGAAIAGGAAMVFVYWLVHGAYDWFFEFTALGAGAFAMGGLACALAPRAELAVTDRRPRALLAGPGRVAGGAVALVAALALIGPLMAERNVQRAARTWPEDPGRALARLERAADFNPLSDRPQLIAGSIALRLGDLTRGERAFAAALDRNPRGVYATLELGMIASQQGDQARARPLLERAARLSPRDQLVVAVRDQVRDGRRVDVAEVNRFILERAQNLVR